MCEGIFLCWKLISNCNYLKLYFSTSVNYTLFPLSHTSVEVLIAKGWIWQILKTDNTEDLILCLPLESRIERHDKGHIDVDYSWIRIKKSAIWFKLCLNWTTSFVVYHDNTRKSWIKKAKRSLKCWRRKRITISLKGFMTIQLRDFSTLLHLMKIRTKSILLKRTVMIFLQIKISFIFLYLCFNKTFIFIALFILGSFRRLSIFER